MSVVLSRKQRPYFPNRTPPHTYCGYLYPGHHTYRQAHKQHLYYNDFKTRTAIYTIEKVKWQAKECSDRVSARNECEPKEQGRNEHSAQHSARFTTTNLKPPSCESQKATGATTTMQEKESRCSPASAPATTRGMGTAVEKLEDYALNRQGRTIYNVQSGVVPNYCGHVPGQKFVFGRTWGASTVNTLGFGHQRPFQWTSLF
ncbi:uncharacterized protein LOC131705038 [Acipenser ruthenus]|uniref:uncharacterized protein LOC131705038 n=1 Tax=Acipenser ruthenus TaxID=7906 RepID=UPI002741CFB4|nr:uncharacterized protein LOC131705038 [Acipenser ruthenus]